MISERTFPILILGNCLEVLSKIPDKSIDMILCDLPYETLNKGNSNASWDRMIPLQTLWAQYERIIKDNGAIVLFSQGLFTSLLMSSNPKLWRYNLVWDKVLSGGQSLGQENPLEEEMATRSSILAWKIPWMEEPGRLQSMGLQRVRHD